ncbi:MAG: DUF309 domain-containing protein [Terriglobia bacterium]
MRRDLEEGIHLFNTQKYFEAHEALEAVWLRAEGDEKLFLHGLIQIAAAFHHHQHGNPAGFGSLLEKGVKKLEKFGESRAGLDLATFREQLRPWQELSRLAQAERTASPPPLPRISTPE